MTIERAHKKLTSIIGTSEIEPLQAAIEVERLRQTWRPENVRVVLLAESHVWTSEFEAECRVRFDGQHETGYARFVYCLGYGESSLVTGDKLPEANSGTWQYWRLFHDCVHGPSDHKNIKVLKATTPNTTRRVEAKIELLKKMQERGLWLVDASVTALYHQGRKLAAGRRYSEALRASWADHVADTLRDSSPEKVLIIGKAVENALRGSILDVLPCAKINCVAQPNARLSRDQIENMRSACRDFCLADKGSSLEF